ncbi:hypothetical protein DB354_14490 [Opitutus sp. ER46]|nr:hypothetical protein DB354_14490 [Opitutus sp. ER46]
MWWGDAASRNQPQRLRMEAVVTYYDPTWQLLWVGTDSGFAFVRTHGRELPIVAGQRVLFEGTVIPAVGISADAVKATVLAEEALPAPVSAQGRLDDIAALDAAWATVEGSVCFQRENDPRHLDLDVLCDGRLVRAHLLVGKDAPVPQLVGTQVRMNFVYVGTRDAAGGVRRIDAWVPRARDLVALGSIDRDPRFALPVTPIDQLAKAPADTWVNLVGEVRDLEAGRSVTLRDATGQITIATEQPLEVQPGDRLAVVGRRIGSGVKVTVTNPLCRIAREGSAMGRHDGVAPPRAKLRLVQQVMELPPDEAARHYPASVRGVVTWSDPQASFFFLEDPSGGIRVQCGQRTEPAPAPGSIVSLTGVSVTGAYAPELELRELTVDEGTVEPTAVPISLEEAMTGAQEAQRVQIRGYLRSAEQAGRWLQLNLTTVTGEFTAFMPTRESASALVGSIVRLSGVCTAVANPRRQLTGIRLWVTGLADVHVEHPRPDDPFTAPLSTVESLHQFIALRTQARPVRLVGCVLYNRPGRFLYLQQEDAGVLVLHRVMTPVAPGTWIELVGLPGRDGSRFVLREGNWRPAATPGQAPVPLLIRKPSVLAPDADARLVTVRARLQDKITGLGTHRLMLAANDVRFEARLDATMPLTALPQDGSIVEITGVYVVEHDESRQPRAFHLEVRSLADVRVAKPPRWWTASRALRVSAGLGVLVLVVVAWVVVLRRRVRQQTEQIRKQMENEARLNAELERSARLESLGVLAGGIAHDFNNLLTVIMSNLGLAAMDARVQAAAGDIIADAERGARRAADLTQQLLTFAKGGDPVRRAVALPDVVRESAEFGRHGSRIRCDYEFAANLPPADVDPGQISRVVHNLVLNAAQAMPDGGVVCLRLRTVEVGPKELSLPAGRYLLLSVEDNGPGIPPERLERIFEPYFSTKAKNSGLGLATVHSIIKKHQGEIRVQSEVGRGTVFDLWLPIAQGEVAAAVTPAPAGPVLKTRILFMDDEEVIRRSGANLLERMGHEVTAVADGEEAVRAFEQARRTGRPYGVVILDLTVPGGMGGKAAMERLRQIDPAVCAIVSSGYSTDPVVANYREYGFAARVPKPYRVEELASAVQEVLRREPPTT